MNTVIDGMVDSVTYNKKTLEGRGLAGCKSQRMTGQGTRGEGKREMVVSITGMSMGGVFLGRVGVFRIS
jgi:hypothetical protein